MDCTRDYTIPRKKRYDNTPNNTIDIYLVWQFPSYYTCNNNLEEYKSSDYSINKNQGYVFLVCNDSNKNE